MIFRGFSIQILIKLCGLRYINDRIVKGINILKYAIKQLIISMIHCAFVIHILIRLQFAGYSYPTRMPY